MRERMNQSHLRLQVLAAVMLAVLLLLGGRLWMLQMTRWVVYARQAAINTTSVTYSPAPRGRILDCHGAVLADNRPVWNVSIIGSEFPSDEGEAERLIGRLAGILGASVPELRTRIKEAKSVSSTEVVPLKGIGEDVDLAVVAQIEEQALELPGILIREETIRYYPKKRLASHVLGYVRPITRGQFDEWRNLSYPTFKRSELKWQDEVIEFVPRSDPLYGQDSIVGQTGIESGAEIDLNLAPPLPILQGRRGRVEHEVDVEMQRVRLIEQRAPSPGATVYLTIDSHVQEVTERALRDAISGKPNRTAAAVAVDVNDGAVLAMASMPDFDPNDWVGTISRETWQQYANDPRHPLLNKAIAGAYPPASTFKMISATAALETTNITPQRTFTCTGAIHEGIHHHRFNCWQRSGHGPMNLRQGLAQSCDVYFYEVIRDVGLRQSDLSYYCRLFGLGERTGIQLPGEIAGLVPTAEWKLEIHKEPWRTGDSLNTVIGQGYLLVNPLQMAMVTAMIANDGYLLRPQIIRKIIWPAHFSREDTLLERQVRWKAELKPDTLALMRDGMRETAHGPRGTARLVTRGIPFTVAAKTGSAQHIPGRTSHAWLVAFAPYDNPRYAVSVFVAEGGHGGSTAAPIANRIFAALFGLKPPAEDPPPQAVPSD